MFGPAMWHGRISVWDRSELAWRILVFLFKIRATQHVITPFLLHQSQVTLAALFIMFFSGTVKMFAGRLVGDLGAESGEL